MDREDQLLTRITTTPEIFGGSHGGDRERRSVRRSRGDRDVCRDRDPWLHVDGALGAWVRIAPALAPLVRGIDRADSLAFDFHKWLHVPCDAGCVLVRDRHRLERAFATRPSYLTRATRGLAGGEPWFGDLGPERSRGFRALPV
ncbi:MAG: PLP-dependent decarboxylase [Acidimicrobiia bacterium]|nr:PLP-dependent decarboxylase [Acidimicrobiia bacterium]